MSCTAAPKRAAQSASWRAVRTAMKTVSSRFSRAGSARTTRARMMPSSSSRFTRRQQALRDRFTRSASCSMEREASCCMIRSSALSMESRIVWDIVPSSYPSMG